MTRIFALFLVCTFLLSSNTYAYDRRVARPAGVLLKTVGAGAGGGLVAGLAGVVIFGGGVRTVAKGVSLGLLGGLAFGLVVLLAPPEMIYGVPAEGTAPQGGDRDDDGASMTKTGPTIVSDFSAWTPVLRAQF